MISLVSFSSIHAEPLVQDGDIEVNGNGNGNGNGDGLAPLDYLSKTCPIVPAFHDTPQLQEYVTDACERMVAIMDYKTGAGTAELSTELQRIEADLARRLETVSPADLERTGLTFENIRQFVIQSTHSRGLNIPVMAYSDAIQYANEKVLQEAGFGFLHFSQVPIATLLETYYDATDRFPKKKGVTPRDVKAASDAVYRDPIDPKRTLNKLWEIRLPVNPKDLSAPKLRQQFTNYNLIGDVNVVQASDVPLPKSDQPLEQERRRYRILQASRLALGLGAIGLGSWYGGGFSAEALTVFGIQAALETQFTLFTNQWAKFWYKTGFKGVVGINLLYAAIIASAKHMIEFATGAPITFDTYVFTVKTLISASAFVGSFGAMQVAASRELQEGQMTEWLRQKLESIGSVIANAGRSSAVVAGIVGAKAVQHVAGVEFGNEELVGLGIQGAYFLAVTGPLWAKRVWAAPKQRELIAYPLYHGDAHPWAGLWFGNFRRKCAEEVLGFFDRFYTWRRATPATTP